MRGEGAEEWASSQTKRLAANWRRIIHRKTFNKKEEQKPVDVQSESNHAKDQACKMCPCAEEE